MSNAIDALLDAKLNNGQTVLTIDEASRQLLFNGDLLLGVEGDINSHRINFSYNGATIGDGIDIPSDTVKVYIDFKNAEHTTCIYEATDVTATEVSAATFVTTFSWLLDKRVAICDGKVSFRVRIVDEADENNIREWHTANFTATVLDGIDVDDKTPEVVTETSSIYLLNVKMDEYINSVEVARQEAVQANNSAQQALADAGEALQQAENTLNQANESISQLDEKINTRYQDVLQLLDDQQIQISNKSMYKFIARTGFGHNQYHDLSNHIKNYNELLIIAKATSNHPGAIFGISNSTSAGADSFVASITLASTSPIKIIMNKTDDNKYMWSVLASSAYPSFGFTESADYKYLRDYSTDTTTYSIDVYIYGR